MKERILVLLTSPNKEGNSATLAKGLLKDINKDKYEVDFVYLYDLNLAYCSNDNFNFGPEDKDQEEEFSDLFAKIKETKKIIISTPIWNFGTPAVLKNFIDRAGNSGRSWSEKKKKKVANWKDKKIYLIFTSGAPKFAIVLNIIAVLQLILSLKYYGAKTRVIKLETSCGNGKINVINNRAKTLKKISKKGKKLFN